MADKNHDFHCDLCQICQAMAAAENRESLLDALAKGLTRLLHAPAAFIRILNQAHTALEPGAWHGLSEEAVASMPTAIKDNPIDATALARNEMVEVRDATKDPRWKNLPLANQDGLFSVIAAPLCVSERCIGSLHVYFESPHEFTDAERALLRSVCTQAASGLWRLLLQRQSEVVAEISHDISSTLEESAVLVKITRYAAEVLMFKAASIRTIDEDATHLQERCAYGLSEKYLGRGPVSLKDSAVDQAVLKGETVSVDEADFDGKLAYPDAAREEGIRSILSLPLIVKGHSIGVLRIYSATPHRFDQSEIRFFQTLANQGAVSIENARLFEHLRRDYQDLTKAVWQWYDWGSRPPKM